MMVVMSAPIVRASSGQALVLSCQGRRSAETNMFNSVIRRSRHHVGMQLHDDLPVNSRTAEGSF
jgi:hypothetical protein